MPPSHAHSKLSNNYYTLSSHSISAYPPSLSSQHGHISHSRALPLYNHHPPSHHSRHRSKSSPPPYQDFMKTVDYRFIEQPPKYRSSFALSDIFEEDEVEIEISDVLPSSPQASDEADSMGGRKRGQLHVATKVWKLVGLIRQKWHRAGLRMVTNAGTNSDLDLLA